MSRIMTVSYIAPPLRSFPFLVNPEIEDHGLTESSLFRFPAEMAMEIATSVVTGILESRDITSLSIAEFDWVMESTGFLMRVTRIDAFKSALELYYQWLAKLAERDFNSENQRRFRVIMLHLSQVFLNDSFDAEKFALFQQKMDEIVEKETIKTPEACSIVVRVLLCALRGLERQSDVPNRMGEIVLNAMISDAVFSTEFVAPFEPLIRPLLRNNGKGLADAWIDKFRRKYKTLLSRGEVPAGHNLPVRDEALQYLRKMIDEEVAEEAKGNAFAKVVRIWVRVTRKNVKKPICPPIPTAEIESTFGSWFSSNWKWTKDCHNEKDVWHPLFALLYMGEPDSQGKLREMARELVVQILNQPRGSEDDTYRYFPIYAFEYLQDEDDLLIEMKEKLVEWHQRCRTRVVDGKAESSRSMLLIYLHLYSILEADDPIKERILDIFCEDYGDLLTKMTSVLCLLASCQFDRFWIHMNDLLMSSNVDKGWSVFALLAAFLTNINRRARESFRYEPEFWDKILSMKEKVDERLILLFLIVISEGTHIFDSSPEIVARLMEEIPETDDRNVLRHILHLSMVRGKLRSLPEELKGVHTEEMYATKKLLITVRGEQQLIIRHGLGVTVYNVTEGRKGLLSQKTVDVDMGSESVSPPRPSSSDEYVSELDLNEDDFAEINRIEAEVQIRESKFLPATNFVRDESVSVGHALLCSMGFLSPDCWDRVRAIPQSLHSEIDKLDNQSPWPKFEAFVVQLTNDGSDCDFVSKETPILAQVMSDLEKIQDSGVCRFDFRIPSRTGDSIEYACSASKRMVFFIVVNETGHLIREGYFEELDYEFVVCISPRGENRYLLNLLFCGGVQSLGVQPRKSIKVYVDRRNLGGLIAIFGFLFNAVPVTAEEKFRAVRGPLVFGLQPCARMDAISHIYDNSLQGMSHVLTAASQCGAACSVSPESSS